MAKTQMSLRDEQYQVGRRALMKWTVAAGAALGVSRSKVFEIIEKTGGKDLAFAATTRNSRLSVHIEAGNGGLAHYTQLWPFPGIAGANNASFSYTYPGQATKLAGTTKPFYIGPATPGASFPAQRQMTCYMAGANQTPNTPATTTMTLNGSSIYAIATVLQAAEPSVIPVIAVGTGSIGTAPGAAQAAGVGNSTNMVGLFNSAASRMGGLLATQANADLYKAHYDAFTQLNRASTVSTQKLAYQTALSAAKFLGTNLAAQLQITPDDLTRYGIDGTTRGNYAELGRTMIITAKAFAMGLTNSVYMKGATDDPHGFFDSGDNNTLPMSLKKIFDGFFADLTSKIDAVTMQPLIDNTVMTIAGDTFKDPMNRPGWGDGTPNNTNAIYVLSPGDLKTGWYGDITAQGTGLGFDETGNNVAYNTQNTAKLALASVAYTIAKRDSRAISAFANGVNLNNLTNPKDQ